ncbi:hypothetical protein D9M73_85380 [compost metagenome]
MISVVMFGARPHSHEVTINRMMLAMNSRTWPKRCDSQPVRGTEMALATPKLVMTQTPWLGLTPRSPAMAGRETLAIDESSTFMKVAADSASVPHMRAEPVRGGSAMGSASAGAGDEAAAVGRVDSEAMDACKLSREVTPAGHSENRDGNLAYSDAEATAPGLATGLTFAWLDDASGFNAPMTLGALTAAPALPTLAAITRFTSWSAASPGTL